MASVKGMVLPVLLVSTASGGPTARNNVANVRVLHVTRTADNAPSVMMVILGLVVRLRVIMMAAKPVVAMANALPVNLGFGDMHVTLRVVSSAIRIQRHAGGLTQFVHLEGVFLVTTSQAAQKLAMNTVVLPQTVHDLVTYQPELVKCLTVT